MTNIILIALTLHGEAGIEPFSGKQAVASVIYNRAGGDLEKIQAVILKPKQFSCWNNNVPIADTLPTGSAWDDCVLIAKAMVDGSFNPVTNASHYFNPSISNPAWARGMEYCATINRHVFLREK